MDETRPSVLFAPTCHVCGKRAVTLEVIPPGELPQEWHSWSSQSRRIFRERRWSDGYTVVYSGVVAGSGPSGTHVSEEDARGIVDALVPTLNVSAMTSRWYDDLGYCPECGVFYCYTHWSPSVGGYGYCPKGHGKSLDPHWSPDDYD